MKRILITLLVLILTSLSVISTDINPDKDGILSTVTTCDTEGRLNLEISMYETPSAFWLNTEDIDVWVINEKGSAINLNDKGTWSRERIKDSPDLNQRTAIFTTDIDTIHNPGDYKIRLNYIASATKLVDLRDVKLVEFEQEELFYCQGYIFSCSRLVMNINSCVTDGKTLKIEHVIEGLSQSPQAVIDPYSVYYYIKAEKQYTDVNGKTSMYGGIPEGGKITSLGSDKYLLEAPFKDNKVEGVTIAYDLYVNKYTMTCLNKEGLSLAASSTCTAKEETTTQETPQETTEETGLGGITGAAVSESKVYSTKTKLLIAALVVIVVIVIGYFLTREKKETEEEK